MEYRKSLLRPSIDFASIPVGGSSSHSANKAKQVITKDTSFTVQRSPSGERSLIFKGSSKDNSNAIDFSIALSDVKASLKYLKDYTKVRIRDLKGEAKRKFDELIIIIRLMTTTGAYDHLHELVTEVFDEKTEVIPETLGAYFAGCRVHTAGFSGNNNCNAICAGSVRSDTRSDQNCRHLSLIFDGKDTFSVLNEDAPRDSAYIFIPLELGFQLLNATAYKRLKDYGVKSAAIVLLAKDGKNYQERTKEFLPLESLVAPGVDVRQVNGVPTTPPVVVTGGGGNSNTVLVIVLIVLLILAGLFIYYRMRSSGTNSMTF